jgi:hypothetical protein
MIIEIGIDLFSSVILILACCIVYVLIANMDKDTSEQGYQRVFNRVAIGLAGLSYAITVIVILLLR